MDIEKFRQMLLAATLLVLCGALPSAMASGLRAQISTTQVALGESFSLMLSVDSATPESPPDLTPLKEHFQILGVSQQSRTSIVNGQRSETFSWVVSLAPNGKGTLTIPALTAGTKTSDPVTIEVLDGAAMADKAAAGGAGHGDVSIDISVDPGTYYVQQEIPVTVRIHDGVGLREARLIEPSGHDFVLTQSGDDQIKQVTKNGRQRQVIERHYFLTPQKSGSLTIPPLTLVATVDDPTSRSSLFSNMGTPGGFPGGMGRSMFGSSLFDDFFNRGREITVRSQPVAIDVKPRPTGDSVWFLPAKQVELKAQWATSNPQFRVGEAMTRTIQLFALGASKEQLPDIPMLDPAGARLYLERSNDKSVDTAQGTAAIREFVVSVVPTQAGEISLPGIEVRWWDTESDTERVASLAAQTITVAAGPANASQAASPNVPMSMPAPEPARVADSVGDQASTLTSAQILAISLLSFLLLVVFGAATKLLITRRQRRVTQDRRLNSTDMSQSEYDRKRRTEVAQSERAFVEACHANDLRAAYSALTAWLRVVRPGGVPAAAEATSFELLAELAAMEKQLYAGRPDAAWEAKRALAVFNKEKRALAKPDPGREERSLVPALYPS